MVGDKYISNVISSRNKQYPRITQIGKKKRKEINTYAYYICNNRSSDLGNSQRDPLRDSCDVNHEIKVD